MAVVIKKRALAEYNNSIDESNIDVPCKRLRLHRSIKLDSGNSSLALISCLEASKNSTEALNTLLRLSDSLELDGLLELNDAVRKLTEHCKNEPEPAVRVRILSLLMDIGRLSDADNLHITEEIIIVLQSEQSHKVIAQALHCMLMLGKKVADNLTFFHKRLANVGALYLKNENHVVKCKCLEIIGAHIPLCDNESENVQLLAIIKSYIYNQDARVRRQALSTLIKLDKRGHGLSFHVYNDVCNALSDDHEIVRQSALEVVRLLGIKFPEYEIVLPGLNQVIRLVDHAFAKICNAVTDVSMYVRSKAAEMLGSMKLVNVKFLHQTLDKKLMSNMRRKRTAHELAWENVTSGEWASGKKWADDAPREILDASNVNLINSGACGAFVHGLEDEFLEVRSATLQSICDLSIQNSDFANMSLDFLVDMFNDEIENVRVKAIDALRQISKHIILRDDQLETILGALEDFSNDIREGLYRMLAECKMSTTVGLQMCISKILDNLKRYPQDKRSAYKCMQRVGIQHSELVLTLTPQLINSHPFFDMAESDVESPQYLCILILMLNAAKSSSSILSLLEPHTLRHYTYLYDTMTALVPLLCLPEYLMDNHNTLTQEYINSIAVSSNNLNMSILDDIIDSINSGVSQMNFNLTQCQLQLMQSVKEHLLRQSKMDDSLTGSANFLALFVGAQSIMYEMLLHFPVTNFQETVTEVHSDSRQRTTKQLLYEGSDSLSLRLEHLLEHCLKLRYCFVGLLPVQQCAAKMLYLRVLAFHIVYTVNCLGCMHMPTMSFCHNFLQMIEDIQRELALYNMEADPFTTNVLRLFSTVEDINPEKFSKLLSSILTQKTYIPHWNKERYGKNSRRNCFNYTYDVIPKTIRMLSIDIIEPSGQTDTSIKFTAGLVVAVNFEAEIRSISDPSRLRIKIHYPDQRCQLVCLRRTQMRPLNLDSISSDYDKTGYDLRVITALLVSHNVWSEACNLEICVSLSVPEVHTSSKKSNMGKGSTLLDLCKPVRISISPKQIRKSI